MQFFFCHFCPPWPENTDSFNSKGPPAWGSNTQSQPTSLCLLTVLPLLEPQWEKMGFLSFFEAPPPYLDHYPWDVGPWQPKMGPKDGQGDMRTRDEETAGKGRRRPTTMPPIPRRSGVHRNGGCPIRTQHTNAELALPQLFCVCSGDTSTPLGGAVNRTQVKNLENHSAVCVP